MLAVNATDVRKEFGNYIDTIVRTKPIFIKRSRDYIMGISVDMIKELVRDVEFTVEEFREDDGSTTLSMAEFGIVVNAENFEEANELILNDLREYALEYYEDPLFWGSDLKRKAQFKKILKVLVTEDEKELKDCLICQVGKS